MHRISSPVTGFYKRIFPALIAALAVAIMAFEAKGVLTSGNLLSALPAIPSVLFLAILYPLLRRTVWDLVDEAYDDGDALIVVNGGRKCRIAVADIKNVNFERFTSRVTLLLRTPCIFGQAITFCAPQRWSAFAACPVVDDLVNRVDLARQR